MTQTLDKVESELGGLMIALCCHHRCEWSPYVGKEFLTEQGEGYRSRPYLVKDFVMEYVHRFRIYCTTEQVQFRCVVDRPTLFYDANQDLDVHPDHTPSFKLLLLER